MATKTTGVQVSESEKATLAELSNALELPA
jgi:hypothetical protein